MIFIEATDSTISVPICVICGNAFFWVLQRTPFTDTTLPAGSRGVIYQITAVRSTRRGEPALFNVNFGVDGGVAHTTKLAA